MNIENVKVSVTDNKCIEDYKVTYNEKINAIQIKVNTIEKYYIVQDNISTLNKQYIEFLPFIIENGIDLYEENFDEYISHKDYFRTEMCVELPFSSCKVVTDALKHQYIITIFDMKDFY